MDEEYIAYLMSLQQGGAPNLNSVAYNYPSSIRQDGSMGLKQIDRLGMNSRMPYAGQQMVRPGLYAGYFGSMFGGKQFGQNFQQPMQPQQAQNSATAGSAANAGKSNLSAGVGAGLNSAFQIANSIMSAGKIRKSQKPNITYHGGRAVVNNEQYTGTRASDEKRAMPMNFLSGASSGAMAGASFGGPIGAAIGGAIGGVGSIVGNIVNANAAKNEERRHRNRLVGAKNSAAAYNVNAGNEEQEAMRRNERLNYFGLSSNVF